MELSRPLASAYDPGLPLAWYVDLGLPWLTALILAGLAVVVFRRRASPGALPLAGWLGDRGTVGVGRQPGLAGLASCGRRSTPAKGHADHRQAAARGGELGGRAAEKVKFDMLSPGASDDIMRATERAQARLTSHQAALEALTLQLLEHETLDGSVVKKALEEA